jgi:Methyltransferase domain
MSACISLSRVSYNPGVADIKYFLERVAFHFPLFHDWLAERDDLRRETLTLKEGLQNLREGLQNLRTEYEAVQSRMEEFEKALWVPPGHFYSPVPAIKDMEADRERIFTFPREIPSVDLNEKAQLELLEHFRQWYDQQPFTPNKVPGNRYCFENPNFSYSDAIVLYFMMRYLRPRRVIEIGSGHSSCAMLDVNDRFFGNIAFTFIDPYPSLLFSLIHETDRDRVKIIDKNVQSTDLQMFRELESGDILFIDSSHVAKTGSDVNHLMFKVLPSLAHGVHVHFHDIFYPFEYPPQLAFEGRAWNEVYLLRAFLSYNRSFEIRFFTTYLITYFRERFETDFPLFMKSTGGSIWLRKLV